MRNYFIFDFSSFSQTPIQNQPTETNGRKWRRRIGKVATGLGVLGVGAGLLRTRTIRNKLLTENAMKNALKENADNIKSSGLYTLGAGALWGTNRKKKQQNKM